MCGRFTLYFGLDELCDRFNVRFEDGFADNYKPRYNIAPSQDVAIITNIENRKTLEMARWGLIPSWSKDISISYKTINARAESVAVKPSYRSAFKKKRCLIPASGFFEWAKEKTKQPYYFFIKFEKVFAFAGLYDDWHDPTTDAYIRSCSIITTTPNELIGQYHDRMPVILNKEVENLWFGSDVKEASDLLQLLKPYPADEMSSYKVSKVCGKAGFDSVECIRNMML